MNAQAVEIVIKVASAVGGFLVAAIPATIGLIKAFKDMKSAQKEAAREAAENEMSSQMFNLIESAETLYKSVDLALKQQGDSAGPLKKDKVIMELRNYAEENGYEFDKDYWSDKIDEAVYLTRKVNVK